MTPGLGRMVIYTLTDADAEAINARRNAAIVNNFGRANEFGAQLHIGNEAHSHTAYPMIITHVHENDAPSLINGQVVLDGSDTHWVQSVKEGKSAGEYMWPESKHEAPVAKVQPAAHETHKKGR